MTFPNWKGAECRAYDAHAERAQGELDVLLLGSRIAQRLYSENVGGNGNLAFATVTRAALRAVVSIGGTPTTGETR